MSARDETKTPAEEAKTEPAERAAAGAEPAAGGLIPDGEVVVKSWEGPIDEWELNQEILRLIREDDLSQGVKEAELSRRYDMRRQHLSNLHKEPEMTMTLPMTTHWGNGRHLNLSYLVAVAEKNIRARHAKAASEPHQ